MFTFKKRYYLIIENTKDVDLRYIKKRSKFIIIYRNFHKIENINHLKKFRKICKAKNIKFYVANNIKLAISLKSNGIYLSANNKSLSYLKFKSKKFNILGSAHNIREITLKKKQGCEHIFLSRLFKVTYKPNLNYLGVNRFNICAINNFKRIIPLGGINLNNLNKQKNIISDSFAILSEVKKKPAKIFSRLF